MSKMRPVSLYGPSDKTQATLRLLAQLGTFHPDTESVPPQEQNLQDNPYEPLYTAAMSTLEELGRGGALPDKTEDFLLEEVKETVEELRGRAAQLTKKKSELTASIHMYEQAAGQVKHLFGLGATLNELFSVKYLKVRFGRLPKESYPRLAYYEDKDFNFMYYDFDGNYYWGVYFTPADEAAETDAIFESLYFERVWVPEFVQGTPEEALENIEKKLAQLKAEEKELESGAGAVSGQEAARLRLMAAWLAENDRVYGMRQYAVILRTTFLISGYVPQEDWPALQKAVEGLDGVKVKAGEPPKKSAKPPVKLKNNWFTRPFEMYVSMYGLPAYGQFDPTNFVALTYSLLFGIMFGDVGQGILLGLVGYFFMYRKKHLAVGNILARCSVSSVFFGLIYGSVFGFEHALAPLYQALGMGGHAPLSPMENIDFVLVASIGVGVAILVVSILLGVYTRLRRGDVGGALFSASGLAGLVFYLSLAALVLQMMANIALPFVGSLPFVLLCVLAPGLLIYFSEPLSALLRGEKPEEGFGGMVLNGFFEMFDALLSFASNTMSFLRVGGFVLAHAGMMSVVFTLAAMTAQGSAAYWLVMAVGNVFVMCLEGLFVAIQVLRLEYYEMFSRFYEADGIPYAPLTLQQAPGEAA
ncbi:MAG: V-type ATPase 116kDa subunit family protein [Oscillospiraceae bacterium]|nr:V-type ATPase 116kDa subunit family protein [Oscillospiraceae bacterium]